MASNYTEHYGLCQWSPGDKFLREEFNGDNQAIETALGTLDGRTETLERTVPVLGYNLMNLTLQSYYDGKYTGYKKALMLDGFADRTQISVLEGGLTWLPSDRCLQLDGQGQSTVTGNFGTDYSSTTTSFFDTWTPTGEGRLTALEYYLGSGLVQAEIRQGNTLLGTTHQVTVVGTERGTLATLPFPTPVPVHAGVTYTIYFMKLSGGTLFLYQSNSGGTPTGRYQVTPVYQTHGSMTSGAVSPGGAWSEALAWVRHSTGTVTLSLSDGSGGWRTMEAAGARNTQTAGGESCRESAFRLDGLPLTARNIQVKLTLKISRGQRGKVFDYGVMVK